ncbi:MAG TPA: hypothetical protein VE954_17775 [Oligoflexus sp.]|uniref:hypothetical protein n=1 Tax=Oligoflexus sp. TaxID=1971216 RepID=UPI002D67C02C|nr:hypothetical protein [Oligoflexus sp.]HYX34948.1 hypothetical protein [Oligoflexus sp.]
MSHHLRGSIVTLCSVLSFSCADEKNPYKNRYETQTSGPAGAATGSNSGNATVNADGSSSPAVNEADTKTAANTDTIAKESLSAVQMICGNQPALAKFAAEMAVLCVNGQPSQAFANALAAPYKGGANPPLVLVKSVDNNGISEFVLLAVLEVPKPITEVFAKRDLTHKGTMTEGNATVTQTELTATPGAGGDQLGSFDVKFDLKVTVGIINVADTRILQQDFIGLTPDKSLISAVTYLKPGAADNTDNILANSVSFWIGDKNTTKLISVNHQMVDNRGQAATAETTVTSIGRRTMTDTYTTFSQ